MAGADSPPAVQALWRRRITLEKRRALQPKSPFDFGVFGLLRGALKLAGLYDRGKANVGRPIVKPVHLRFDGLPPAFDGYRILHLSDFHFDERGWPADAIAQLLKSVRADLCVMTGDYRFSGEGPHDYVVRAMERICACIQTRHGTVGVLGNHDPGALVDAFERLGIRMLVNDSVAIVEKGARIWLLGVDDPHHYRCDDLILAGEKVPADAFKILLAHSPEIVPEAEAYGVDLYLCGHTHAGQVRLPYLGAVMLNVRSPRRYGQGLWRAGRLQGYTTAGLGATDVPVRFNCPPEAALIHLSRTQGSNEGES